MCPEMAGAIAAAWYNERNGVERERALMVEVEYECARVSGKSLHDAVGERQSRNL